MPRPRPTRPLLAVLAVLALVAGLAACSADASTRTDDDAEKPTTTAAPVTTPSSIPAGVTLRVGDQLDYLKTVLKLGHQDQDFPYKLQYSGFVGGPPMLQAFQGGSIDAGFVGSTPLIFAQASGQEIVAVAGWGNRAGAYGLVTAPGQTAIRGWKDLKGKKVAYQKGTAGEAVLLEALDNVGLELGDVTTVDLPQTSISAALQGRSADAAVQIEPLTSVYLAGNPTAKVVAKAEEITDRSSFFIATKGAIEDDGRSAAIGDFLTRLVKAFKYLEGHQDEVAETVYHDQYGLPLERAKELVAENGPTRFVTLPGQIVKAQQRLADLFHAAGEIPDQIDVRRQFDTRYNDLVEAAQGAGS